MDIEKWWPLLSDRSRQWLIANNGDVVAPEILEEIWGVTGDARIAAVPPYGLLLGDENTDWIEERANDERGSS